jgi:wyosine [tRNA(Phe)-imidazoG37] synthetase (radical SAM superfamily)
MFKFRYIYGPVYSWRLGRSLGVDPLSAESKICNMDCVYCQLGKTASMTNERKEYITAEEIVDEIKNIPLHFVDYITFSGRGEPTLARNLGEIIRAVKKIRREKIAVITNGLLLDDPQVCKDLMEADFVLIKLDAGHQQGFEYVDGMHADFNSVLKAIHTFRLQYKGKLALQVMVLEQNLDQMDRIASFARLISPQEVQLNTPLRPSGVKPVSRGQMEKASHYFEGLNVVTVFDKAAQSYTPIDDASTITRHGNFRKTRAYI